MTPIASTSLTVADRASSKISVLATSTSLVYPSSYTSLGLVWVCNVSYHAWNCMDVALSIGSPSRCPQYSLPTVRLHQISHVWLLSHFPCGMAGSAGPSLHSELAPSAICWLLSTAVGRKQQAVSVRSWDLSFMLGWGMAGKKPASSECRYSIMLAFFYRENSTLLGFLPVVALPIPSLPFVYGSRSKTSSVESRASAGKKGSQYLRHSTQLLQPSRSGKR